MQSKHNKQKGYAAVLTLVLFSALSLSLFAVFNSSQIVTHKLKLQNAVDAATYSSANVVSRELNHMAYTNRAMVANQMIIGQMVGLLSWDKQMVNTGKELKSAASKIEWIPYIGKGIKKLADLFEKVTSVMSDILKLADLPEGIEAQQNVIIALSKAQELVHEATGVIFARTFPDVLKANNDGKDDIQKAAILPTVSSSKSSLLLAVDNYDRLERVQPDEIKQGNSAYANPNQNSASSNKPNQTFKDFKRLEKITKDSDDGFVGTKYDWGRTNYWGFGLYNRGGNEFELRKQDDGKYKWEWSAMDTVAFYVDLWFWDYNTEIGWGAAHATSEDTYKYKERYNQAKKKEGMWGNAFKHPTYISAEKAIDDYDEEHVGLSKGIDLLPFYKYKNKTSQEVIGPEFIAAVSKDQDGVRTRNATVKDYTGNTVPQGSSLDLEAEGNLSKKGKKIFAVAKAQVYFARSYEKEIVMKSAVNEQDILNKNKKRPEAEVHSKAEAYAQAEIKKYDTNVVTRSEDFGLNNTTIHKKEDDCIKGVQWKPLDDKRTAWLKHVEWTYKDNSDNGNGDWVFLVDSKDHKYKPANQTQQFADDKANNDLTKEEEIRYALDVCENIPSYMLAIDDYKAKVEKDRLREIKKQLRKGPKTQFSRNHDTKIEYANIFNPYWQVRLADYKKTEINKALWVLKAENFIKIDDNKIKVAPKL